MMWGGWNVAVPEPHYNLSWAIFMGTKEPSPAQLCLRPFILLLLDKAKPTTLTTD